MSFLVLVENGRVSLMDVDSGEEACSTYVEAGVRHAGRGASIMASSGPAAADRGGKLNSMDEKSKKSKAQGKGMTGRVGTQPNR